MKWYALFVQSGNELAAQKWLNVILNHNFSSIVPRRRLLEKRLNVSKEVVKIIFPGYIFRSENTRQCPGLSIPKTKPTVKSKNVLI